MATPARPLKPVKGRGNTVPCTLALDRHAYELLRTLAPSARTYGVFVSGLLYAEVARREERQRLRQLLDGADVLMDQGPKRDNLAG